MYQSIIANCFSHGQKDKNLLSILFENAILGYSIRMHSPPPDS